MPGDLLASASREADTALALAGNIIAPWVGRDRRWLAGWWRRASNGPFIS